jgi:hypothetical protein
MIDIKCEVCDSVAPYAQSESDDFLVPWFCLDCTGQYPPSLLKACVDSFDYELQLRNGLRFAFSSAHIHGEFATIMPMLNGENFAAIGLPAPRGIDIRVDEIVWCCDAPAGS